MTSLFRKLVSKKGESLVESLCAILIFTMASIGMYSMVMSAARINTTAKETDQRVQTQMAVAEKAEGDGESGTITMVIKPEGSTGSGTATVSVAVKVFRENEGALYSYYKDPSLVQGGSS